LRHDVFRRTTRISTSHSMPSVDVHRIRSTEYKANREELACLDQGYFQARNQRAGSRTDLARRKSLHSISRSANSGQGRSMPSSWGVVLGMWSRNFLLQESRRRKRLVLFSGGCQMLAPVGFIQIGEINAQMNASRFISCQRKCRHH